MTSAQKAAAAIGLCLIAISSAFAPYKYRAYDDLARIVNGRKQLVFGVRRAPLWAKLDDVKDALQSPIGGATNGEPIIEEISLDSGRLALWWAGIAAATIVGVVLLVPSRAAGSGTPN